MKLPWRILVLAAGLSFFGWYLADVGLGAVWNAVRSLGLGAPLLLLPYLIVYGVDCAAWARTLPPHEVPFLTLLRIRWAGESVNNVVPSAYVGGEAVKVCLLRNQGVSATAGATSAVVSKTAQSAAQLAFVLIASAALLTLGQSWPGLWAGLTLVALGGSVLMALLFWMQRAGFFRMIFALLRALRWHPRFLEERRARLLHLDETIQGFYRAHPRQFCASAALYFAGWLLDCVEIYLVAQMLGLPITWVQALVVEAFTGMAKALGMWVPGSLGIQESGIVLMGRVAGLPDTLCASYALIRRARELIFAAVGLLFLYADGTMRMTAQPNAAVR